MSKSARISQKAIFHLQSPDQGVKKSLKYIRRRKKKRHALWHPMVAVRVKTQHFTKQRFLKCVF